jgi:hypothetical protein
VRGLATALVTEMVGIFLDRTSEIIGNRAWDRFGTGLVTRLVREPVTELADLKGRFNK